jgi:hypothetical protein
LTLFNFRLTPIESVAPWGHDDDLHLSWFGLTDGCYWLRVGENELFRYQEQFLKLDNFQYSCPPYVDYYVVRLWEDLLEILPEILIPVPLALSEKCIALKCAGWEERTHIWIQTRDDVQSDEIYEQATGWYYNRCLYSSYLNHGPRIWFWSDGTYMHIEWDNREKQEQGIPVWEAQLGSWSLSIVEFLEEIRAFDRELMDAMQTRVDQVMASWDRPKVRIDKDQLVLEHAHRAAGLNKELERVSQQPPQEWTVVLDAISLIETEI